MSHSVGGGVRAAWIVTGTMGNRNRSFISVPSFFPAWVKFIDNYFFTFKLPLTVGNCDRYFSLFYDILLLVIIITVCNSYLRKSTSGLFYQINPEAADLFYILNYFRFKILSIKTKICMYKTSNTFWKPQNKKSNFLKFNTKYINKE